MQPKISGKIQKNCLQIEEKLRVISGKYRGRKLNTKKGDSTRPTLDRTKETLFNILRPMLENTNCMDIFAGSGQMGIEMLSNFAYSCIFVDNDSKCCDIIKSNLQMLGETQRVLCCDYKEALKLPEKGSIDLIFADPPFRAGVYEKILQNIATNGILASDGIVVCESDIELCQQVESLHKFRQKRIGSVFFSFFKQISEENK